MEVGLRYSRGADRSGFWSERVRRDGAGEGEEKEEEGSAERKSGQE